MRLKLSNYVILGNPRSGHTKCIRKVLWALLLGVFSMKKVNYESLQSNLVDMLSVSYDG